MNEPERPKRVVVVDADNPLNEISGQFYWREDHERLLAQERESAYRRGFQDGWNARSSDATQTVILHHRRFGMRARVFRALLFLGAFGILLSLVRLIVP